MKEFKKELSELLRKHSVEISIAVEDDGHAYGINFWSYTQYDSNDNITREAINFEVGRHANWEDFLDDA